MVAPIPPVLLIMAQGDMTDAAQSVAQRDGDIRDRHHVIQNRYERGQFVNVMAWIKIFQFDDTNASPRPNLGNFLGIGVILQIHESRPGDFEDRTPLRQRRLEGQAARGFGAAPGKADRRSIAKSRQALAQCRGPRGVHLKISKRRDLGLTERPLGQEWQAACGRYRR